MSHHLESIFDQIGLLPDGLVSEQKRDRMSERLGPRHVAGLVEELHRPFRRSAGGSRTGVSATQREPSHSPRMTQHELLGDHSPERDAKHMRAFDFKRIKQRRRIVRHSRDGKRFLRLFGPAHAAIVE